MKKIKIVLLLVFLIILFFSCYNLYKIKKELNDSNKIQEQLINKVEIPNEPKEAEIYNINFDALKETNTDIIGWIKIDDTNINYPIVQGKNNSYYLNRTFDKSWNALGSIFADYRAEKDFLSYNTFIYGHHTKNGTMFGELYKFMKKDFYNNHSTFNIYTPERNYIAEIFSVYLDSTTSESYKKILNNENDFREYLEMIKEKSNYITDVEIDPTTDKIITLYSCSHESNRQKTDRYYIHAVLKSVVD